MAIATAPASVPATLFRPESRETAEDRWEGLMLDRVNPNDPSKLALRLDAILVEIMGGMGREPIAAGEESDLVEAICAWLMQWVMAGGVAPTEGREFTVWGQRSDGAAA
jgi:hypothetical protein